MSFNNAKYVKNYLFKNQSRLFSSKVFKSKNFLKEFDCSFKSIFKDDNSSDFLNLRGNLSQNTKENAVEVFKNFNKEGNKDKEQVRFIYNNVFLNAVLKPKIDTLQLKIFTLPGKINFKYLPYYGERLKKQLYAVPDHCIKLKNDKLILVVEDHSGKNSIKQSILKCSFMLSALSNQKQLEQVYGVATTFEKFAILKYTRESNRIELSTIHKTLHKELGEKNKYEILEKNIHKLTQDLLSVVDKQIYN